MLRAIIFVNTSGDARMVTAYLQHQGFEAEYRASIERILEDPVRWRIRGGGARRLNLKRSIWIVAVAYGGRKPFYWKRRAEEIE